MEFKDFIFLFHQAIIHHRSYITFNERLPFKKEQLLKELGFSISTKNTHTHDNIKTSIYWK